MASLLKGASFLKAIQTQVSNFVAPLPEKPHLAIILVGENPASHLYVGKKKEAAAKAGCLSTVHRFPETASQGEIENTILELNATSTVHGILVQLPLPRGFDRQGVLDLVDPVKDVDGLTTLNAGRLYTGKPFLIPCTPLGCLYLIKQWREDLRGLQALVLGQSTLVGKPLDFLLLQEKCTVIMAHKSTRNLPALAAASDIVVAAAGAPRLVQKSWIKPGACVIDVGIHLDGKKVYGDVDFDAVREVAGAITPVPGGVGPTTIGFLLHNLVLAYKKQKGISS